MKSLGTELTDLILGDSINIELMNKCVDLMSIEYTDIIEGMKRVIGYDHNDFVGRLD